ncbi:MAG: ribbon-helix-helix domain-containing protein [Rhodospirillaceae bacterium]|nr:ribbon-helix-helix domain-containing protein [Rhodospirillaceae bacterium]
MNTLSNRNVTVNSRRTSMRLEQEMWEALREICRREDMTVHELCSLIDDRRGLSSLTAATRVFILMYYRAAATDEGHTTAGHGKRVSLHLMNRLGVD